MSFGEQERDGECSKKSSDIKTPTETLPIVNAILPDQKSKWNIQDLGMRLGADATAAAMAAGPIAPFVCFIDRSIIEKAATGSSFSSCFLRALRPAITRPHTFIISKPFLLIFGLYTSTYFAANSIDTLVSTAQSKPKHATTSGAAKFVATSATNMSLTIYKDSRFVKWFGNSSAKAPAIPKISLALFAIRDSMTIFASFNLPPIIAPQLTNLPPSVKRQFSRMLSTEKARTNTAQFFAPAAMQIFSTPLHLLGLDMFNRPQHLGVGARVTRILRDWGVSAFARMGRIIPAYGVGGVLNFNARKSLMLKLQD